MRVWPKLLIALAAYPAAAQDAAVLPAALPKVATVSDRFQSYNIEMVEVTGGRFWKPYRLGPATSPADRYSYRPPVDLANPRLRTLAAALAPAYVRVSGTWASTTAFVDADAAPPTPPAGFKASLTAPQWRGVIDFARATGGALVISTAASAGTRDASGAWTPVQLNALLTVTRRFGGSIAAAEFVNEANLVSLSGAPESYTAGNYGRDFKAFRAAMKVASPQTRLLGPSGVGEGSASNDLSAIPGLRTLPSSALLAAGGAPEIFSYHHYGALSQRCVQSGPSATTQAAALSDAWLDRTERSRAFYAALRDTYAPGAPLWLSETAQAACGGDPWAATFVDSFRYLDQLGQLARAGVEVVMHNTLAASDYALLDENSFAPRPNYWAALLWRRLMGTTVLDPGPRPASGLRLYAHCLRGRPGGVALLVLNTGDRVRSLALGGDGESYTLTGTDAAMTSVALNGTPLTLDGERLPAMKAVAVAGRTVSLPPASITFIALEASGNAACR